ncbi:MAG: DUF4282 domain-containing protein [Devosia sp.]|uniref:DUF4282 domain-containing protein n=1 Tax=Devosia sp. TaxID=1871048 RepID=UPI001A563116|nr:DUF4282 domain-containing protein [Devosia sp.]MBL8598251.1 DUF4282 domain-containing protein [Devosia sp.]
MTSDDLKRIFGGNTLFRMNSVLGLRLIPLLYVVGLFAFLLWGVEHLFATFAQSFGAGLWGLLQIVAYGALGILLLRVLAEMLLVYFRANESTVELINQSRTGSASLLEDVRDAIHDIADQDEDDDLLDVDDLITPATVPAPDIEITPPRGPRRTARRTPGPKL